VRIGRTLLILNGRASFPAKAQNPLPPSSENLPSKPDPGSNSHKFKPMNPYEYPNHDQRPNLPTHQPIDTTRAPPATQLEPFDASSSEAEQEKLTVAQKNICVHSNEVVVPVTVLNNRGEQVLDLAQKDFHVFDNGAEQPIDHWDMAGDPLAVALVLETSTRIIGGLEARPVFERGATGEHRKFMRWGPAVQQPTCAMDPAVCLAFGFLDRFRQWPLALYRTILIQAPAARSSDACHLADYARYQ
jgi:hypothetical protein